MGASLFDDRYGLRDRRPAGLSDGGFAGDGGLEARLGGGDLLVRVCGDDRQVVFDAVLRLANAALGIARRRWTQHGFLSRSEAGVTPRNVLGFRDGTANLSAADGAGLARHVRVLRRSYNYDDGATVDGDADAGVAFICFAADPGAQVGRLLRRFGRDDALREYAIGTAGAVFAIPPAPGPGEHIGQRLLAMIAAVGDR